MAFVSPAFQLKGFTCPYCDVYSNQAWWHMFEAINSSITTDESIWKSSCNHCRKVALWHNKIMVTPDHAPAPMPHNDLPEDCKADFLEARSIISRSPRGAAALLRLIIQKLMPHLGEKGNGIDADIAALVQKGLPVEVQQALDACRVIGNNAVHPGEIVLNDAPEVAVQMFELINFIVENRISQPKKIKSIYSSLPAKNLAAIQARDKKTP